jgi:hypothetical protein
LTGLRKENKLKIKFLQVIYFRAAAWQQIAQPRIVIYFCQCGYRQELNTKAILDTSTAEEDDAFQE